MSGGPEAPPASASPFKGLTHFTEDDFGLFFGRERERDVIVANLKARRLTVLYGESGVGKSSLLRAGVMSALRDEAQRDFEDDDVRRPAYVPAIVASWSGEPLQTLIDELAAAAAPFVRGALELPATRRLDATIDALAAQTDARMLVILDQLEEYFLYHGDEAGDGTLASELPRALARPQLRASFLLSIREDALAKLDRFKRAVPDLFDTVLAIGPLGREAGRQAIVGPLRAFEGPGPKDAEPALVDAVLDQVAVGQLMLEGAGQGRVEQDGGAPAARAIEAPYLQLVLARLWEEESDPDTLRLETLERLGGAEAIVRRHLDTALGSLDEPERLVAADALRYLVTPSGTKIALGPDDLTSFTGREDVAPVLEKLTGAGARILRAVGATRGQANGTRYEIAHDVLGAAVLDWRSRFVHEQERLELERRAVAERQQLEEEKREAEAREAAERRRARTFRTLAGAALAMLLAAVAFLAYALVEKGHAEHAQRVTKSQLRAAQARNALDEGRLDVGIPLALAAYDGSHDATTEDTLLAAVHDSAGLRRLLRFRAPVEGMAVDPLGGGAVAASVGRTLVLRTTGGAVVARRPTEDVARGAAFSADGRFLAAALGDGSVVLFHVRRDRLGHAVALERAQPLRPPAGVGLTKAVAFSPSGRWLAAATNEGVLVWPFHDGVAGAPRLLSPTEFARGVTFCATPGGHAERIAAAFGSGRVVLWPSSNPRARPRILQGAGRPMGAVACSPDGALLAAGGDDQLVTLFGLSGRARPTRLTGHKGGIEALAFGRGGRVLASGADDGSVMLWDVSTTNPRQVGPPLHAHSEPVVAVGFDRGGETLAAGSGDGRVSIWNADEAVRAGGGIHVVPEHLNHAAFGDGVFATATSADQVLVRSSKRPDLPGRVPPAPYQGPNRVTTMAVDPGGRWLALGLAKDVQLFRLGSSTPREERLGHPRRGVELLALASDGTLAAALDDGTIRALRAPSHHGAAFPDGPPPGPRPRSPADALAVASLGETVAAAYGNRVVLWRPGRPAVVLHGARGKVQDLAFGAGGLLAASAGNAVTLWEVEKARFLASLPIDGEVAAVAFSPDGRLLASTGDQGPVRIWDVQSRRQLGEPLPTPAHVSVAALGFADAATLAAAYSDGTAGVWNLRRWRLGTSFDDIRKSLLRMIDDRETGS